MVRHNNQLINNYPVGLRTLMEKDVSLKILDVILTTSLLQMFSLFMVIFIFQICHGIIYENKL